MTISLVVCETSVPGKVEHFNLIESSYSKILYFLKGRLKIYLITH